MLATYVPLPSHEPRGDATMSDISKCRSKTQKRNANGGVMEQKVTPRQPKPRVSRMKGHLSKRTAFVREIVREVSG